MSLLYLFAILHIFRLKHLPPVDADTDRGVVFFVCTSKHNYLLLLTFRFVYHLSMNSELRRLVSMVVGFLKISWRTLLDQLLTCNMGCLRLKFFTKLHIESFYIYLSTCLSIFTSFHV